MLLPLLTRNVCIYLLNVSFFLFLFTIPSTRQIHYENSLENQSVLRNWALFDERPKKNKIIYNGPRCKDSVPNILNFLSHGSNFKGEFHSEQFMSFLLCFCVMLKSMK